MTPEDEAWMRYAIRLAQRAEAAGEVPVGAVLVKDNQCVSEGWNSPISLNDPSAHAEINALRQAGQKLANYRLLETTLYVTLEPCLMCVGALVQARVTRLVFGAYDPKRGAVESAFNFAESRFVNHRFEYTGGVLAEACGELLKDFFLARR
ncbi:MAG: tRNA adenosine(34) deaminase TadA [Methylobacter sp.]|nr:MAG: tRNA adenosine(34) deaminase TadA [Methylobacter sp.]